jgi:hypothetical protein
MGLLQLRGIRTVLAFCFVVSACLAQQNFGRITGLVRDPSGAVIVDAAVSALHEETGIDTKVATNSDGSFTFPALSVGSYTLRVGFAGFKTAQRDNIRVVAGQTVTLDFDLAVGETSQIATVTAESPLVDTKSTGMGVTRTVEEIRDLPLQMSGQFRNYLGYLQTLPGISYVPGKSQATYDGLARAVIQGVGTRGFTENFFSYNLDGVSGISFVNSGIEDAAAPLPETVEEFRLTTNFNAEFGANLGVGFDLVTKSGTNSLHGTLFHYLRNDAFDARNFFASSVSALKQNQFGVVIGGPVVIPKLYNGKNRTFFFGSYDGFRLRGIGQGQTATVPTARMRNGDFGELLGAQAGTDALGRQVFKGQIFDPRTNRAVGSSFVRDPFPNNIIPADRFSAISLAFQKGYPLPTLPGTQINWAGPRAPQVSDIDRATSKIDHQFTNNHRLTFANDSVFRKTQDNSYIFSPEIRDTEIVDQTIDRWRLIYTWVARPDLIFGLRGGYTRGVWDSGPAGTVSATYGYAAGIRGVYDAYTPRTTIDGIEPFGSRYATFLRIGSTAPVNTDVSWVKGKHNYKFGAEMVQQIMTNRSSSSTAGVYNFTERGTGSPNLPGSGAGYASFLLGDVNDASITTPRSVKTTARRWGFYAQDSWRVTPKLTLNYGLRYDIMDPMHEAHNRTGSFDPSVINAKAGGLPGALTFWGQGAGRNGRSGINNIYWNAWGPRLGIAYAMNEKTTIRLYYGLVYSPVNAEFVQGENIPNYGWAATVSTASVDNGVTPAFNWNNGFPSLIPTLPNLDPSSLNGVGLDYIGNPANSRPARSQNLGFGVERVFPAQILVKADYVGKLTHGLFAALPWNQLDPRYLSLGNLLTLSAASPDAAAAGIRVPFQGFVGSVAQALRPYPQYLDINQQDSTQNFVEYHSLQLTVQRRFKNMTLLGTYTASKLLNGTSFQHQLLRDTRKAIASQDRPQMLNLSYSYELPFGPGRRFLNGTNPVLKQIVGGWQIAGIHNYYSGFPVTVTSRATLPGIGNAYPVRVGSAPISTGQGCADYDPNNPLKNRVLNPAGFAAPAPFTFGNTRVLPSTRACGYLNESVSVLKNFTITESVRLRFGAEIFNLLNRHQWMGIQADVNNPDAFGRYSSASDPRTIQLELKLEF